MKETVAKRNYFNDLSLPHIEAFNFAIGEGLENTIKHLPRQYLTVGEKKFEFWVSSIQIRKPEKDGNKIYPRECRESSSDYAGPLKITLSYKIGEDGKVQQFEKNLSNVPIMVGSSKCFLEKMTPKELIKQGEDQHEFGGYFLLNGTERLLRLIIANKRNFPLAMIRSSWTKETDYSDKGIFVRSVRSDEVTTINVLHYLNHGTITLSFGNPYKYKVPIIFILKALKNVNDKEILDLLLTDNNLDRERIEISIRETKKLYPNYFEKKDFLKHLGSSFKQDLFNIDKENFDDEKNGQTFIDKWILIHLNSNDEKFNFLILMIKKLFKLINNEILIDDQDSLSNQEVLTGGQIYLQVLNYSIEKYLESLKTKILRLNYTGTGSNSNIPKVFDFEKIKKLFLQPNTTITGAVRRLLSTGNVNLVIGQGIRAELPQFSGYSIVADKINFTRFISHFRAIHRGAPFMDSRTTSVRRLKPEAWGFICPVHTPDGAPCGLLNHLSQTCYVVGKKCDDENEIKNLKNILLENGMISLEQEEKGKEKEFFKNQNELIDVLLDGKIIGKISFDQSKQLIKKLKYFKTIDRISKFIEFCLFPIKENSVFPLFGIYTHKFRFMRPVINLRNDKIEYIGVAEQLFMSIACKDEDFKKHETTHKEISPTSILSYLGNLTPFSDFNQSPRNVYQCQMSKQTMAIPTHTFQHRTDNKLYRLQTPQRPLSQTDLQEKLPFNDYPTGTNAIVAVISHTGYDMEDAMIVNKSSYERGLAHGSMIKTKFIDFKDEFKQYSNQNPFPVYFSNRLSEMEQGKGNDVKYSQLLDLDGLPQIGTKLTDGVPIYSQYNSITKQFKMVNWKSQDEDATVENVIIISNDSQNNDKRITKIQIVLRINRNPTIGDKFSSRHGQKGVLSLLWPEIDMPFSESGIKPDIIINPHAFPSRMTIGMLLESMSSKSGALHGYYPDATPFKFSEENKAVDHFGEQLKKAGYNYYGNEPMYCGLFGTEFKVDIFIGVVYYQRLRHMVKDKFQVRSIGSVDRLTHQPVKGRKRGGGIRFGEMERDGLLSYGCSFLLRDRLFHCSDEDWTFICTNCGGLLVTISRNSGFTKDFICKSCNTGKCLKKVAIPYVFKYLSNELASMNIKMRMDIKDF
eukprot:gene2872-4715_t